MPFCSVFTANRTLTFWFSLPTRMPPPSKATQEGRPMPVYLHLHMQKGTCEAWQTACLLLPTAGGGSLPSSSLQSHYMQDQVCAVPDFCTAASAGSSGELSAFLYLPVWLTMQYMKLWSIELCYLKGWGFFLFPFLFGLCGGECLAGFSFFFLFLFCQKKNFLEDNSLFLIHLQVLNYLRLRKSNWF